MESARIDFFGFRSSERPQIVAQIEWIDEPTTLGTTIRVRTNHFYDTSLGDIARHLCERAEIRHAIVNSVAT